MRGFRCSPAGRREPQPELVTAIDRIAPLLSRRSGTVVIRGHTDNRPYRTASYDNWRLSTARAHMAYHMLIRGGLPEARIERVEGYADRQPRLPMIRPVRRTGASRFCCGRRVRDVRRPLTRDDGGPRAAVALAGLAAVAATTGAVRAENPEPAPNDAARSHWSGAANSGRSRLRTAVSRARGAGALLERIEYASPEAPPDHLARSPMRGPAVVYLLGCGSRPRSGVVIVQKPPAIEDRLIRRSRLCRGTRG